MEMSDDETSTKSKSASPYSTNSLNMYTFVTPNQHGTNKGMVHLFHQKSNIFSKDEAFEVQGNEVDISHWSRLKLI